MKGSMRGLAALLAICCALLAGCAGKPDLAKWMRQTMMDVDIPIPNSISKLGIGHFEYSDPSKVEERLEEGMTLATMFAIPSGSVPKKGHLFSLESSGRQYSLLMDDAGKLVAGIDVTALSNNANLKHEQLKADSKAGAIGKNDISARFDEVRDLLGRVVAHVGLQLEWKLAPVEANGKADTWHRLTEEQLRAICGY